MLLPDKVKSLWIATTPKTNYPQLNSDLKTDVVIVGGGIAGLNAAYFLKQAGLKVILIEATNIALGTSGNTTAKVTSQHELKYSYLVNNFGKKKAQMYADSNQWAIFELEKIITKENIDCDFHKVLAYTYAEEEKFVSEIQNEVQVAKELNLPASFVDFVDSIPFKIYGAIKFDNQAYFHPRKYLLALANIICNEGSYIFEQTKALDIQEHKDECEVVTNKGNIKAKRAIIATNFPFYDKQKLFASMPQTRSFVLAAKSDLLNSQGMFIGVDSKDLSFRSHQSTNEKWLLVGGIHHSMDSISPNDNFDDLAENASARFDIKSFDYKWAAQDSNPDDRVPYIGFMPKSNKVLVTTGFGAWGMTTSFVSAKLLTDLITGKVNAWEDLYSPSRIKLKVKKENRNMDINTDEGKIINKDGKQVAVYKDEAEKEHSMSAICTHMGCTVGWNNKDKTWDCPCHGSRFDKMGKVINGPATEDLALTSD